jgi:hypothetical protein
LSGPAVLLYAVRRMASTTVSQRAAAYVQCLASLLPCVDPNANTDRCPCAVLCSLGIAALHVLAEGAGPNHGPHCRLFKYAYPSRFATLKPLIRESTVVLAGVCECV